MRRYLTLRLRKATNCVSEKQRISEEHISDQVLARVGLEHVQHGGDLRHKYRVEREVVFVLAELLDDSPGDEDGVPLEEDQGENLEKPASLHLAPEEVAKEGEVAEEHAHGDDGGHDGPRGVEAAWREGQPEVEEVVGEGPLLKQSILEQSQFAANASIGALAI